MLNNNGFQSDNNKMTIIKIAGGFILFTVILFLLILAFTSSDDSVSTGGAFASADVFRQTADPEKKPKMQSANAGVMSSCKIEKTDSASVKEKYNIKTEEDLNLKIKSLRHQNKCCKNLLYGDPEWKEYVFRIDKKTGKYALDENGKKIREKNSEPNPKGNTWIYNDCINEPIFDSMHEEAKAYDEKKREALMGGVKKPVAKQNKDSETANAPKPKKTAKKKTAPKTNIPRMTLGFGPNSIGRSPKFVGSKDSGSSGDSSGMGDMEGFGGLGEGMPDLSNLQGAGGQVDQNQLNNLMKNLPSGNQ